MGGTIELPDIKDITFILENSRLVVVTIEVVRAREKGHDGWETRGPRLSVHPIAKITARVNFCQNDYRSSLRRTQRLEPRAL